MPVLASPPLAPLDTPAGFKLVEKNTFIHFAPEEGAPMQKKTGNRRSRCLSDLTGDMEKAEQYREFSPSQLSPILDVSSPPFVAKQLSPVPSDSDSDEQPQTPVLERKFPWTKGLVPGQPILSQLRQEPEHEPRSRASLVGTPEESCSEPDQEPVRRNSPSPDLDLDGILRGADEIVMDGFESDDEQPGTPCYLDRQPSFDLGNRFAATGPNPFSPPFQHTSPPGSVQAPSFPGMQAQSPPGSVQAPSFPGMQAQSPTLQAQSPQVMQAQSPTLPAASPLPEPNLQQASLLAAAQLGFVTGQQMMMQQKDVPQVPGLMPNFQMQQGGMVMPVMPMLFNPQLMQQMMQMQMQQMPMPQQQQPEPRKKAEKEKKAPKKEKREPRQSFQPPQRDPLVPITELTLMLKNIPNKYKPDMMLEEFKDWRNCIDFFYMPIDFKNNCNLGYAFVNFHDVSAAERFRAKFHEQALPLFQVTGKIVHISEARVQGKDAYVERFRNSSVMADGVLRADYKPMLFDTNGNNIQFPEPDGELPALGPRFRRQR